VAIQTIPIANFGHRFIGYIVGQWSNEESRVKVRKTGSANSRQSSQPDRERSRAFYGRRLELRVAQKGTPSIEEF
jgi:hypothetical protein